MRVSEEVWDEIAKRGKFGESVDDVLRRVFGLEPDEQGRDKPNARQSKPGRRNKATNRMSAEILNERLIVSFRSGDREEFGLPNKTDKNAIRTVRDNACEFAERHGATLGQVNAVKKALTEAGYYVSR